MTTPSTGQETWAASTVCYDSFAPSPGALWRWSTSACHAALRGGPDGDSWSRQRRVLRLRAPVGSADVGAGRAGPHITLDRDKASKR